MLTVWCIVWYSKKPKFEQIPSANLDADDPLDDDDEEDSDEDDSEDDAAELQAELMKIKKERAADQARKVRFQVFKFSSYTLFQKGNMYRWNTSINMNSLNEIPLAIRIIRIFQTVSRYVSKT